jgi:L-lysine exporter family protein LysE/ArgO
MTTTSETLGALASGFALALSVCLDLGLVNVTILRTALRDGARAALWVGLGSCFGDIAYFALSAAGVTAALSWGPARWILWIGGTVFLGWLVARSVREALRPHAIALDGGEPRAAPPSWRRAFALGLGLALASPTSILWFAAVGGSVIAASAARRELLWPLAAGFYAGGVAWSIALAYGAAALGRAGGPRVVRWLSAASAVVFAILAVVVFRDGLRAAIR